MLLRLDCQRLRIEEPKLSEEQEEMGVTVRWRNVGHRCAASSTGTHEHLFHASPLQLDGTVTSQAARCTGSSLCLAKARPVRGHHSWLYPRLLPFALAS